MRDTLITTQALTKTYGRVQALTDLNIQVPEGAIVGFLGPNGSGKTTAIRILLGLARPTSGSATLFDMDSVQHSDKIRQRVGYLAQSPRFDTTMTPREIVRFSASLYVSGPKSSVEDRIQQCLELVDLQGKEDRRVRGFSGGEAQRLGIAQAVVNEPDLLILDEPAASLDPVGRAELLKMILALRGKSTVFFSTHILEDVQRTSDYLVILKQGRLIAQGRIDDILGVGRYVARVRQAPPSLATELAALPFIQALHSTLSDNLTEYTFTTIEPLEADREVPRVILAHADTSLVSFGQQANALEDVFIDLVKQEGV